MATSDLEPLQLELDWEDERGTLPSIPGTPPPPSGFEWIAAVADRGVEAWSLEWVDDIPETPHMFADEEITIAETPDAKKRPTLRAAPPPPCQHSVPPHSVTVPAVKQRFSTTPPTLRAPLPRALVQEAVAALEREVQRRAG